MNDINTTNTDHIPSLGATDAQIEAFRLLKALLTAPRTTSSGIAFSWVLSTNSVVPVSSKQ